MDGETLYSIGDLARRTGLTVKAIRFYSDRGIVPPSERSPAGHRRYGADAVARLELVRTLRDLGLDLATIRQVVDRELDLPEVAAAHAEALVVQIQTLRLRHAVLTAVAKRGSTPEEMDLMHKLAKLSEDERRRLIADFLDAIFAGIDETAGPRRTMTPELPDNPEPEQVQAWVELAELAQDPDFRASMRRMAGQIERGLRPDLAATVRDQVRPLLAVDPASPQADAVVEDLTAKYPDLRQRLEIIHDPRRDQYLQRLAVINGWQAPEDLTPALAWCTRALSARTPGR
jgi:DNA-binding transcriptional MerR regulator